MSRKISTFLSCIPRVGLVPYQVQMTTVADENVHCIELDGSFDDCQNIMKTVFADEQYKANYHLGAVNSVNWARCRKLFTTDTPVYAVQQRSPSAYRPGILAMFLPLIWRRAWVSHRPSDVATNDNDILARFFDTVFTQEAKFTRLYHQPWIYRSPAILNDFCIITSSKTATAW